MSCTSDLVKSSSGTYRPLWLAEPGFDQKQRCWVKKFTLCRNFIQTEKYTTSLLRIHLRRSLYLRTGYSWGSCSPGWYHAGAGTMEDLGRRNHPMYHSCFPHHLSPCPKVWDMLNMTRGVGMRREGEQLTSEMSFFTASALHCRSPKADEVKIVFHLLIPKAKGWKRIQMAILKLNAPCFLEVSPKLMCKVKTEMQSKFLLLTSFPGLEDLSNRVFPSRLFSPGFNLDIFQFQRRKGTLRWFN